jgi:phage gp37-like protein
MNDLLVLREAIVASFNQKFDVGVSVESHGGTFDLGEIRKFATLAPAIRVALVGCGRASRFNDGRWMVPVHCAAVVITRDAAAPVKIARDAAALLLVSALQLAIASNRFGLEGVRQPEDVAARNEYSGPVEAFGVALWQVTWTSSVLIGNPGDPADIVIKALTQASVNGTVTWTLSGGLTDADPAHPEAA